MFAHAKIITSLYLLVGLNCAGQINPTLIGLGYGVPSPINIAPGQIIRLQVAGLALVSQAVQTTATGLPLPTQLGGVSVTLTQTVGGQTTSYPLPLVDLYQTTECSNSSVGLPRHLHHHANPV